MELFVLDCSSSFIFFFSHHPALPAGERVEIELEGRDGRVGEARGAHLGLDGVEGGGHSERDGLSFQGREGSEREQSRTEKRSDTNRKKLEQNKDVFVLAAPAPAGRRLWQWHRRFRLGPAATVSA